MVDDSIYSGWQTEGDNSCEVVFDYLIGKEVNQSPTHQPGRKVINFFDWLEDDCKKYEKAYQHVLNHVKPERESGKDKGAKESWWRFLRPRPELFHLLGRGHSFSKHPKGWNKGQKPLERVIVFARAATKYPCFTLVPNSYVYSDSLCVIASDSYSLFACISSDLHTVWAWDNCSRMKQDMRYTHGDIFETFPFPDGALDGANDALAELGERYFYERSATWSKTIRG